MFGFIEQARNISQSMKTTEGRSQAQSMLASAGSVSELGNLLFTSEDINENISRYIDALMRRFTESLAALLAERRSSEIVLFFSLLLAWCIIYYVSFHRYFQTFQRRIWLSQGMVTILPFATVIENEKLYRAVVQWSASN